jgi:hypothetical protein
MVIEKPECSTLLSGLPLVSCTESFDRVSTCCYHKLQSPNCSNVADSNLITSARGHFLGVILKLLYNIF